jgi:hypothetical protein
MIGTVVAHYRILEKLGGGWRLSGSRGCFRRNRGCGDRVGGELCYRGWGAVRMLDLKSGAAWNEIEHRAIPLAFCRVLWSRAAYGSWLSALGPGALSGGHPQRYRIVPGCIAFLLGLYHRYPDWSRFHQIAVNE